MNQEAINRARTVYYGLFASAFAFHFGQKEFIVVKNAAATLAEAPVDDASELALGHMQRFLEEKGYNGLKQESDLVFFSPATTHIPMTASFYYEKRDDGNQRVLMLEYVLQSGFRRNTETFKENEDHVEFMFLFMQQLIRDQLSGNLQAAELAHQVFTNILNGMLDRLADNILNHEKSVFYRDVALLLRSFIEVERQFFEVAPPVLQTHKDLTRPGLRKEKIPPRQMVQRNMDEFESV